MVIRCNGIADRQRLETVGIRMQVLKSGARTDERSEGQTDGEGCLSIQTPLVTSYLGPYCVASQLRGIVEQYCNSRSDLCKTVL